MLTLDECCILKLGNANLIKILNKDNLLSICLKYDETRNYLPDNIKAENLTRDFLLMVNTNIIFIVANIS